MADDIKDLARRVEQRRTDEGLSYRQLGTVVGVPFSTLARVARGEGKYARETERKIRLWLGDPVSHITPADLTKRAEELGRAAARAFSAEIANMIHDLFQDATP